MNPQAQELLDLQRQYIQAMQNLDAATEEHDRYVADCKRRDVPIVPGSIIPVNRRIRHLREVSTTLFICIQTFGRMIKNDGDKNGTTAGAQ